jgi:hypothetical protein
MAPARFQHLFVLAGIGLAVAASGCAGSTVAAIPGTPTEQQNIAARSVPEPAPTSTDALYAADGPTGVSVINVKSGKMVSSFGSALGGSAEVTMDDAGNVYDENRLDSVVTFNRLAVGGNVATATYTPTSSIPEVIWAAPTGEVIVTGIDGSGSTYTGTTVDVWDAGSTGGKPSRSITHNVASGEPLPLNVTWAADGTLYVPYYSQKTLKMQYDVIPPGKSKPTRTIVESIVPAKSYFSVNWMSVAPDGTLYVAEWGYYQGDPYTGLYVYPSKGQETHVTNGAPFPTGLDLDKAGNVYVVNSSSTASSSGLSADTTHLLTEFAPHATKVLRQVSKGFTDGQFLTVDDNGTAYIEEFPDVAFPTEEVAVAGPTVKAAKMLTKAVDGTGFVLYNGKRAKSVGASPDGGGGGALARQRLGL